MSAFGQGNYKVDVPRISMAFTNWSKFYLFWARKLRFFKVQFVTLTIFQGLVGCYVAKRQMDIVQEELGTKFAKVEVQDSSG